MFTLLFFFFVLIGILFRLVRLISLPFYDWDESIYAEIAKEMSKNKTWITTFNGRLWLEKPPLPIFFYRLFINFKPVEFWLRLVTVAGAIIFLLLLYLLSKKIINSLFASELKKHPPLFLQIIYCLPIMVSLSSALFFERLILVNTDLWLAIGWVGFFLVVGNFFWETIFLLVGVLSKSLLGFYPIFLMFFPWPKNIKSLLRLPVLIIITSVWYIVAYLKFGQIFIKDHLFDHLIKRISSPIELHFGGKMFYFIWLYKDLFLLPLLFIPAYLLIAYDLLTKLKRDKLKVFRQSYSKSYLILFSPLPFFFFLTLVKTKINWYLIPLIPLFALSVPYLILEIKQKKLQLILILFIVIYFLFKFVPQTYLSKPITEIAEKTTMGQCVARLKGNQVDFLVDSDQREIGNFLDASHLGIDSSFIYGDSPAFIYYSQKKVNFFYKISQFITHKSAKILVISRDDYKNIEAVKKDDFKITPCLTQNFLVMTKN